MVVTMQKEIVISPKKEWWKIDLAEIWSFRELLFILAWRDVAVRYKQTILGISWAIFQPLVTTGVFSIFFGKIAKVPSDGMPYPLFAFMGLTFWGFFSNGVINASNSLINNGSIISKVYFPKVIVPISSIITAGLDFLITFALMIIAVFAYGYTPLIISPIVLPILLLIILLTTAGLGFFMAALNIQFRDVRFLLPFFIQSGLYLTPVIYPLSVIYDWRKWILMLNPLTSVMETARALVLGTSLNWTLIGIGLITSLLTFLVGLYIFRKTEDLFVDIS